MSAEALNVFACELDGVRLIEASAGTGKTWNICGIYLRLVIERQLEVQKILVVTFTKAATAELTERIRSRLTEVLAMVRGPATNEGDPFARDLLAALEGRGVDHDRVEALLERAIRNFDEAAIFTIHGFCKRTLDDTPMAAGMPLRQEMLEDDREMRHEVTNDFWRREIAGGRLPAEVVRWLYLQNDTPERLAKLLRRHGGKSTAHLIWPPGSEALPAVDIVAFQRAFDEARALWLAERDAIVGCVMRSLDCLNSVSYKEKSVDESGCQWDAVLASPHALAHPPGGKDDKLKLLTADWYAEKTLRKAPRPCEQHAFFDAAQALMNAWAQAEVALELARMHLLRRFVSEAPAELRELKRRRRLVAFDDMLFNLHAQLEDGARGERLAASLRQGFPAALIDEFQDTDPLQFAIFDHVYRPGGTLFLVGDPKQAIYSFRNADLHTYLEAAKTAVARYSLAENQRSSEPLIGALNAVFGANPRAFMLDGLGYEPVKFGKKQRKAFVDRTQPRAALQLWQLPAADDGPLAKSDAKQLATRACAAEVARLLDAAKRGEIEHGKLRLRADDIAVLVRSHREGSAMRAALAALGVGSVELAQTSVFETTDAEELERVLDAVLDPGREGRVRSALATELLGLDASALESLAADEVRTSEMTLRFRGYRETWAARGIGPMLRELAVREAIDARLLARPDGERRLTNYRHLAECLHEASRDHPGPEALLRWFKLQRIENRAEASQVRLESDSNLVQIVTIHKSKGLEYPVVFCPYLFDGHPGGMPSQLPGREYHDEDGRFVIDYREEAEADAAIKSRMDIEKSAERLRLIYVALTRAVHRCYLVVGGYKVGKSTSEAGCNPLNWLVTGNGRTPQAWREAKTKPGDIVHAWANLASANGPAMQLAALPEAQGVPIQLERPAPESLVALASPKHIPRGWQMASYSSLAHGSMAGSGEAPAQDRDGLDEPDEEDRLPAKVPPGDVLGFPRGARAGDTMHAVFERVDFADASQWPQRIAQALRAKPPGPVDAAEAQKMLLAMVGDVLAAPLHDGIVLSKVGRRIVELEFTFPAPALVAARLSAALRETGYPAVNITQPYLSGYLRGFIDLVFEHEGRVCILDWKSTYLGVRAADYGHAQMKAAMTKAGYHLQYLLYTVAVHRWLRSRVEGYDYDKHFGCVLYLFVRGVRPGWTLADGSSAGVFVDRPPRALIEKLDALMGTGAGKAEGLS